MFGFGYVNDFILNELKEKAKIETMIVYIADSLYYSSRQKILNQKLADLLHPKKVSKKTGDQIAEGVLAKLARGKHGN